MEEIENEDNVKLNSSGIRKRISKECISKSGKNKGGKMLDIDGKEEEEEEEALTASQFLEKFASQ